jgi:hypothetical protein
MGDGGGSWVARLGLAGARAPPPERRRGGGGAPPGGPPSRGGDLGRLDQIWALAKIWAG